MVPSRATSRGLRPMRAGSWSTGDLHPDALEDQMRDRFRNIVEYHKKSAQVCTLEKPVCVNFLERLQEPRLRQALARLAAEIARSDRSIQEIFTQFDLNGDGMVSREEMKIGLRKMSVSLTPSEVDGIMKAVDTDGSGDIDYHEFADIVETYGASIVKPGGRRGLLRSVVTTVLDGLRGAGHRRPSMELEVPLSHRCSASSRFSESSSAAATRAIGSGSGPASKESAHHGLRLEDLPGMVKVDAIQDREDMIWLETVLDRLQRPALRQALDVLAMETKQSQHALQLFFSRLDLNGDGMLSKAEITAGLRKMNVTLKPTELDAIMRMFDVDGNGLVDSREFAFNLSKYSRLIVPLPSQIKTNAVIGAQDVEWIETVLGRIESPKLRRTLDRLAREIYDSSLSMHHHFVQFDLNGDGVVSKEEMQAGLRKMKVSLQPCEVDAIMRAFDADSNGLIDYKEFAEMLARYARLTLPSEEQDDADDRAVLERFPVGCRVRALFSLPRVKGPAPSSDSAVGTVVGLGAIGRSKGTLEVQFKSQPGPMTVRPTQIRRTDECKGPVRARSDGCRGHDEGATGKLPGVGRPASLARRVSAPSLLEGGPAPLLPHVQETRRRSRHRDDRLPLHRSAGLPLAVSSISQ